MPLAIVWLMHSGGARADQERTPGPADPPATEELDALEWGGATRLAMLLAPDGPEAARYRQLRARLRRRGDPQVVAVTGPASAVVAVNLALAFAECRRHDVALVEATPLSHTLARLLGRAPASWREEPPVAALPNLRLVAVAVGQAGGLEAQLQSLRARYAYVVVDLPASLRVPTAVESLLVLASGSHASPRSPSLASAGGE